MVMFGLAYHTIESAEEEDHTSSSFTNKASLPRRGTSIS